MLKFILLFSLIPCWLVSQISPEKEPFPAEDFVVYASKSDSVKNMDYQIGKFEPTDLTLVPNHIGQFIYLSLDETSKNKKEYHLQKASIYLKVIKENNAFYYALDDYYDADMYQFPSLKSDDLVIVSGRYRFYIYDVQNEILSSKIIPGIGQYEGEDAISPLFSALTFFDGENFLLGNVQGFGVFCIDVSNPAQPIELKQYSISNNNSGQFYAFLKEKKNQIFDIIVANSDPDSENKNIRNLFRKLENVKFSGKNIPIFYNEFDQPDVVALPYGFIIYSFEKEYQINLFTGKLTELY